MNMVPVPAFVVALWALAGLIWLLVWVRDAYLWILKRRQDKLEQDRLAYFAAMQCRRHDLALEHEIKRSRRTGWYQESRVTR